MQQTSTTESTSTTPHYSDAPKIQNHTTKTHVLYDNLLSQKKSVPA